MGRHAGNAALEGHTAGYPIRLRSAARSWCDRSGLRADECHGERAVLYDRRDCFRGQLAFESSRDLVDGVTQFWRILMLHSSG